MGEVVVVSRVVVVVSRMVVVVSRVVVVVVAAVVVESSLDASVVVVGVAAVIRICPPRYARVSAP